MGDPMTPQERHTATLRQRAIESQQRAAKPQAREGWNSNPHPPDVVDNLAEQSLTETAERDLRVYRIAASVAGQVPTL